MAGSKMLTGRKKMAAGILLCFMGTWLLTGCRARELESRKFPLVLEINEKDGELVFACAWPSVKDNGGKQSQGNQNQGSSSAQEAGTDNGAGGQENGQDNWKNDEKITRVTGKTLKDALNNMQSLQDKYVDYSQVKAIIWGKDMVKNEMLQKEVLDWLESSPHFARNILIFKGKTQDLSLETVQEHAQGQPGAYLENLYKNNEKFRRFTVTLKEFLYS